MQAEVEKLKADLKTQKANAKEWADQHVENLKEISALRKRCQELEAEQTPPVIAYANGGESGVIEKLFFACELLYDAVFTDIVRNSDVALNLVEKSYPELLNVARRFGYYQRLDYLLHIPVSKMTPDNSFYMEVVAYIRKNRKNIASNEYLTLKQKSYLMILSTFPRQIRSLHAKIRGL